MEEREGVDERMGEPRGRKLRARHAILDSSGERDWPSREQARVGFWRWSTKSQIDRHRKMFCCKNIYMGSTLKWRAGLEGGDWVPQEKSK